MSQHDRDFEDLLRRALHSAADSLEPARDGLERIRARLTTPYAAPVAWMIAACAEVARRVLGGLGSIWAWLQVPPGPARQCRHPPRPGAPPRRHPPRVRLAAAAVAAAVAAAIAVSAVTPPLRQAIARTGTLILSVGRLPGSTGGLQVSGHGAIQFPRGAAATAATPGTQAHTHPSQASCATQIPGPATPSANPAATTTPTTCAAPARSPSPSASPSPTLSPTPSASPTASASPSPSASPTPSASPSASPSPLASPSLSASPSPG
jgi:hypothetical protein